MMLHPKALAGTIQCKLLDCQGEIIRMGTTCKSAQRAAGGSRRQIQADTEGVAGLSGRMPGCKAE